MSDDYYDDDYGLGLKVHEDAYRELEEQAERYRLEANAMMLQRDRLAEAIRKHRDELELTSGDSVDRILWNTLAAVKGGQP